MALAPDQTEALQRTGCEFSIQVEDGMTCIVIHAYGLPVGFTASNVDLLLRLNPAFPDVPPDMWWFDPPVLRADSATIQATDHFEQHLGRRWQRWSRHLDAAHWHVGTDSLESFLAVIRRELQLNAPEAAKCA